MGVGVDWGEGRVVVRYYNTSHAGATGGGATSPRHPTLTALACTTDVFGLATLTVTRQLGLWVPDELTVTGFDDVPDAAEYDLTTVHQPILDKGRVAGQLLLDEGERPAARHVLLPTELIVRNSSGSPRH